MKKHFLNLFEYNDWANQRVLITLEQNNFKNEKILLLFSHMLSAQFIWLNRIKNIPASFPLWEQYKLRELRTMTEESSANWRDYISNYKFETFEEMIFYKDSRGMKHENTFGEIVTHVINHGTYHRGQIAILIREEGIDPPVTDFIVYERVK